MNQSGIKTAETAAEESQGPDEFDGLRDHCRAVMDRDELNNAQLARQLGIATATFSAWYNGTYTGRNDRVAADVERGLDSMESRAQTAAALPPDVAFQWTPTAKKIMTILQFGQAAPDIVVIAAGAGVGKTTTVDHYAKTNANVWKVTAQPCTATVYPMLGLIAEVMDLNEKVQTRFSRAIEKFVKGKNGLLIVDEAQHLDTKALDQLRSIHDASGVGLALVGNEKIYGKLGRQAEFAQLFSRIGMTLTQVRPRAADVDALIDAWDIKKADEKKALKIIARKPGALRGMTKTLRLATMIAGGPDGRALDHIKKAFEQLTPEEVAGS